MICLRGVHHSRWIRLRWGSLHRCRSWFGLRDGRGSRRPCQRRPRSRSRQWRHTSLPVEDGAQLQHAVVTRDIETFEEMIGKGKRMALRHGFGEAGSKLIVLAGVPFGTPGSTNLLHVVSLSGDELKGR